MYAPHAEAPQRHSLLPDSFNLTALWYVSAFGTVSLTPSKMRLIQLPRRNASGIGRQLSCTAFKSPWGASAAVSRLPVRPQRRTRSKTIFSRDGSTSAALAVSEEVSYPTYVDDVRPVEALRSPQAMSYSWVGLTGGQIFRDMMRRHNVKHICESSLKSSDDLRRLTCA